jgi:pimeloyl-ACP methyl ester carboxylesterase
MDQAGGLLRKLAEQHGYIVVSPLGFTPLGAYGNPLRLPAVFGQEATAAAQRAAVTPTRQRELNLSEMEVMTALEVVTEEYGADRSRTFLAGHSMGSGGAWHLAARYPERWRAVAPMSGPFVDRATYPFDRIKKLPIFMTEGTGATPVARGEPRHVPLHARRRLRVRVPRSGRRPRRHGAARVAAGVRILQPVQVRPRASRRQPMPRSLRVLILTCGLLLPAAAFAQRGAPADAPPPRTTPRGPFAVTVESYPTLATPHGVSPDGPRRLRTVEAAADRVVGQRRLRAQRVGVSPSSSRRSPRTATWRLRSGRRIRRRHRHGAAAHRGAADRRPHAARRRRLGSKQNADRSSPFYKKIDVSKVAVMGQSCGGLQAIAVSPDPRVTTSVIMNSGVLPAPGRCGARRSATRPRTP